MNFTNFKLYCYQINYNKYNKLLINLQNHIQYLYTNNIININDRNTRLSDIYNIIQTLNDFENIY